MMRDSSWMTQGDGLQLHKSKEDKALTVAHWVIPEIHGMVGLQKQ